MLTSREEDAKSSCSAEDATPIQPALAVERRRRWPGSAAPSCGTEAYRRGVPLLEVDTWRVIENDAFL